MNLHMTILAVPWCPSNNCPSKEPSTTSTTFGINLDSTVLGRRMPCVYLSQVAVLPKRLNTVKPFNLAALKVGDFACIIILAPFILVNSSRTIPTHE